MKIKKSSLRNIYVKTDNILDKFSPDYIKNRINPEAYSIINFMKYASSKIKS